MAPWLVHPGWHFAKSPDGMSVLCWEMVWVCGETNGKAGFGQFFCCRECPVKVIFIFIREVYYNEWPKGSQWWRIIGIILWSNSLLKRKQTSNIIEPENGPCSAAAGVDISYNIIMTYFHNIDINICIFDLTHGIIDPVREKPWQIQVASRTCSVTVLEAILIKSMESRKRRCFGSFPCLEIMDFTVFLTLVCCQPYDVTCEMCAAIWSESLPLQEVIGWQENPFSQTLKRPGHAAIYPDSTESLFIFYDAVNHLGLAFSQSNHETLINKLDLVLESSQWTMLIDPFLVTWLIPFTKKLSW